MNTTTTATTPATTTRGPGRPSAGFNPATLKSFVINPGIIMANIKALANLPKALPVFLSDEAKTEKVRAVLAGGGMINAELLESLLEPVEFRNRTMTECAADPTVRQVEISAEEIRAYFAAIAMRAIDACRAHDSRTQKYEAEKAAALAAKKTDDSADDDEKDAVPGGDISDDDDSDDDDDV